MRFFLHTYDILKHGAPVRLRRLKGAQPIRWREFRPSLKESGPLHPGLNNGAPIWYAHESVFRREKFADEIVRLGHTGWYSHHEGLHCRDGSGLVRGIVVRLSHGRVLAGYYVGDSGEHVYFPEVFTDEEEAARMADEHARVVAEEMQEHSRVWDEARALEAEEVEAYDRLCECLALRNNPKFRRVRDEIREIVQRIREIQDTLKTQYSEVL